MTNKETFQETSLDKRRAGDTKRFVLLFSNRSIYDVYMQGKGASREHAIEDKRGGKD